MENRYTRREKIRIFSLLFALVFVLAVFAVVGNVRATKKEQALERITERAVSNLDDSIQNMTVDLEKGLYSNSVPMLSKLSVDLSREASGAKKSLSLLPIPSGELQNTYKFLSQVGDFVLSLQRKLDSGIPLTEEEREQLFTLLDFAKTLCTEISDLRERVFAGEMLFENSKKTLSVGMEEVPDMESGLKDTEQTFEDYPTLLYDGPFSDHMLHRPSAFLDRQEEISKDRAHELAARILNVPKDALLFMAEEHDAEEAFRFYDEKTSIAITKRGGYLLYMLSKLSAGEEALNVDEARKAAQDFLVSCGYVHMVDRYYVVHDGICTFNFAFQDGDYTCYPDLIKVSVSLEDGSILSLDARNYLLNHDERTFSLPKISREEAKEKISPLLRILDVKLAVIPTKSGQEKPVWELRCQNDEGHDFLVYIHTQTGIEEDLLLLLYADDGILTK